MTFGLNDLLRKATEDAASGALQEGLKAASEGVGRKLADTPLSPARTERIAQVRQAIISSGEKARVEAVAQLAEDAAALGLFVAAAREQDSVESHDQEAMLDAVEELGCSALRLLRDLAGTHMPEALGQVDERD